ncbi:uncharacterized protein LOC133052164 [Dama dama]|uniref:uncharacterized protein LOC133052164 n=1 Tax=Dama dama TaxID=30532 RepID=UPI002A362539|nr:uncharacterized protein LOC133052164 [Dama dama]
MASLIAQPGRLHTFLFCELIATAPTESQRRPGPETEGDSRGRRHRYADRPVEASSPASPFPQTPPSPPARDPAPAVAKAAETRRRGASRDSEPALGAIWWRRRPTWSAWRTEGSPAASLGAPHRTAPLQDKSLFSKSSGRALLGSLRGRRRAGAGMRGVGGAQGRPREESPWGSLLGQVGDSRGFCGPAVLSYRTKDRTCTLGSESAES